MKRAVFAAMAAVFAMAGSVDAGPKTKVTIIFADFPKGTVCNVDGAVGQVRIDKKKRQPRIRVKGHGEVGTYFCQLPDGRKVKTDVNTRLPELASSSGITVYPDGSAYVTTATTDGHLLQQQFTKTLKNY